MKGRRHSPEQIVKILREAEAAKSAREVIRRHQITEQTFYRWKKVYAGMEVVKGSDNMKGIRVRGSKELTSAIYEKKYPNP